MRAAVIGLILLAMTGCAGKVEISRPMSQATTNSKVIRLPRDVVWNRAVPNLGKQFFVINNLDRSSGLINQ